jgi:Protein of unknown function (DUF2568)
MSALLQKLNLTLRGLMELGIVAAMGYWGFQAGSSIIMKIILCIIIPSVVFGFWGFFDFRKTGVISEPLRLVQELVISGLAVWALYVSGQHLLGWILGVISIIHHILIYLLGETLIK